MKRFKIGENFVGGPNDSVFIIAEIGQNHQGNMNIAKDMIAAAKKAGCNCVKFQKSCLTAKFTKNSLQRRYDQPNSWGRTYGEHKEFLEFSTEQYKELIEYASKIDILLSASAMDVIALEQLIEFNLPFIKIGSGDANNFQLIEKAAEQKTPLIISTGMQSMQTIEKIISIMEKYDKKNYCLMHCVSSYPTKAEDATLDLLNLYRKIFPETMLGYSGHEIGQNITLAAVLLGAKVIERHFTLNKQQKGTDHICSLEPTELKELVEKIREIEKDYTNQSISKDFQEVIPSYLHKKGYCSSKKEFTELVSSLATVTTKTILNCENACRMKLGKSLVFNKKIQSEKFITKNDIACKVTEPFGISAEFLEQYINRKLKKSVENDQIVSEDDFFL